MTTVEATSNAIDGQPAVAGSRAGGGDNRLFVLDGWRAISILLVLATHLLPLGPKRLQLNVTSGTMGMSLFFTLSGFLITQQLHARRNVPDEVFQIEEVPRTLSGKVLEVPVKRILMGTPAEKAASRDSLANPAALDYFTEMAARLET